MATIPKPVVVMVGLLAAGAASAQQGVTTTTTVTRGPQRPVPDNEPGWAWLMQPRELKVGHRLGQAGEGLIISGYSVVDESGVLRVHIVQTGPRLVEVPACRLVVLDREGKRHLPKWTESGGFRSGGMQTSETVFALDPKVLPPGKVDSLGIESRVP